MVKSPTMPRSLEILLESLTTRFVDDEAQDLEFKLAGGGLPRAIWPTISAFANTSGGWLILGIEETHAGFVVAGAPNASHLLQTFWNQMRNRQRISAEVCATTDTFIERVEDKELLIVRIPAAPRTLRPIFIENNPYAGTFVRRNSGDFLCSKTEVDRMMREAAEETTDRIILTGYGWDDLDHTTFTGYRRRFQTARPNHPWNRASDQEFLRAIRGYRQARDRSIEGITVAGLLMFGHPAAIRDWRTRHMIDYRVLPGEFSAAARWDDRLVWEGNLLDAFDTISARLEQGLPIPFKLDGPVRIEQTPAHVALREALVNLLVHTDYAETLPALIFRSPGGFYFQNPGSSRVPDTDLTRGKYSDPRNPDLVFMFRMLNLAEEAGSGVQSMIQNWRELGYRAPEIDAGADRYEFSLAFHYVHLISDEDREWLARFDETFDEVEQMALLIARYEGSVDNRALRALSGQHRTDTTMTLGRLRDHGLLEMIGSGRWATYRLPVEQPAAPSLRDNDPSLRDNDPSLRDNDPSLRDNKGMHSTSEWEAMLSIATEVRARARVTPEIRAATILRLCAVAPLTIDELSRLLKRGRSHTRATIANLVDEGRLFLDHPDRPTDPRQRYSSIGPKSPATSME